MWLDSKAVNCPQKWGNFIVKQHVERADNVVRMCLAIRIGKTLSDKAALNH